jgi:hypothetical protein
MYKHVLVRDGLMPVDPTPSRHRRQRWGKTILAERSQNHQSFQ